MGRQDTPGGAPKGAINLSAPDGAPLPLIGGREKRTKGWPGTQFHRDAERWLTMGIEVNSAFSAHTGEGSGQIRSNSTRCSDLNPSDRLARSENCNKIDRSVPNKRAFEF